MYSHTSADRKRNTLVATAGLLALLMLAWVAVGQTRAYFSGTTENAGNSLGTTSVTLSNNRASALFNMSGMLPGSTETQTISIQNPSAAAMGLRLFGADFFVDDDGDDTVHGASDIADYLDIEVKIDSPDGDKTVFTGTLAQFAVATAYGAGFWTCSLDPDACAHQPVGATSGPAYHEPTTPPPATPWVGVLETTLRALMEDDIEEDPSLEDFWAAVQAADLATKATQEDPTPAGVYAQIPEATRNLVPEPIRVEIEDAIGYPTPTESPSPDPTPTTEPGSGVGGSSVPAGRGDRINAVNEAWSVRTYTFTVTMAADAGEATNLGPNHRAGITFVWEGRA